MPRTVLAPYIGSCWSWMVPGAGAGAVVVEAVAVVEDVVAEVEECLLLEQECAVVVAG